MNKPKPLLLAYFSFIVVAVYNSFALAIPSKVLKLPFIDKDVRIIQGWNYNYGDSTVHEGIDFKKGGAGQSQGFTVTAAAAGQLKCYKSGKYSGYGNVCIIEHTIQQHTFYTLYAHLVSDSFIKESRFVSEGEPLGEAGSTGAANGVIHLHFEVEEEKLCMSLACRVDPYDIYAQADKYPGGNNYAGMGSGHWWADDPPYPSGEPHLPQRSESCASRPPRRSACRIRMYRLNWRD